MPVDPSLAAGAAQLLVRAGIDPTDLAEDAALARQAATVLHQAFGGRFMDSALLVEQLSGVYA